MTNIDKIKQDLLKYIDNMEIDVSELESYEWHAPVRSYYSAYPEDESEEWDEEEEYQAKLEKIIDGLEDRDYLSYYVKVTDEEDDDEDLKLEIINWLKSLQD